MSITTPLSSIASSSQTPLQLLEQEFQQLGQDLQSGDLSAAQQDFVTLRQDAQVARNQTYAAPSTSGDASSPLGELTQDLTRLQQDLASGDLASAQQDYVTITELAQSSAILRAELASAPSASQVQGGQGRTDATPSSQSGQLFTQLGEDLQSGNLAAARQTYQTLQQSFQQPPGGSQQGPSSSANTVSVTA